MIAYMDEIVDPYGETPLCLRWQYRLQMTGYNIDGEIGVRENSDKFDINDVLHLRETWWRPANRRRIEIHIGV
jgi:hypothetical protein